MQQKTTKSRASNGSGSIRQKANGNYELRYTQDGKQKSKSFQSFSEADKARRRITAAVDAGTYVDPSKMLQLQQYHCLAVSGIFHLHLCAGKSQSDLLLFQNTAYSHFNCWMSVQFRSVINRKNPCIGSCCRSDQRYGM